MLTTRAHVCYDLASMLTTRALGWIQVSVLPRLYYTVVYIQAEAQYGAGGSLASMRAYAGEMDPSGLTQTLTLTPTLIA